MLEPLQIFFTDWLPSLAIVGGGIFTWWRWRHSEKLRLQNEIPSADLGTLCAMPARIAGSVLVQLDALWRNPGRVPFEVDTQRTAIDVFEITADLKPGPLQVRHDPADLGNPAYVSRPFAMSQSFKFEPGTNSLVQTHFILPENKLFLFRWKLYRKNSEGKPLSRTRFLLLDTNTLQATSVPGETGVEETA